MSLDQIPTGTTAFVDSTILHYAFVEFASSTEQCICLLDRVAKQEVIACLSVPVLNDAVHKLMCSEAAARFQRPRAGLVRWMKDNPDSVRHLTTTSDMLDLIGNLPVNMLPINHDTFVDAQRAIREHGLLANDAIIVSLMQRHGITHLATNDDDFDRVLGITVWKPR